MNINILKKAHCGKVSTPEKETLTYNIGHSSGDYYFRITDNDTGDYFSNEWISLNGISELLPNDTPFNKVFYPQTGFICFILTVSNNGSYAMSERVASMFFTSLTNPSYPLSIL
jgi:hypothetical protein